MSGCERIATDIIRWQSKCQEYFGELDQPDSEELVGSGEVVLHTELPPALVQACLEEGVAPFGDWSLAEGVETVSPALEPPLPPPSQDVDAGFVSATGVPWVFRGHSVVQAHVVSGSGQDLPDLLFCKVCGASVHSSARGLQGSCKGAEHPGLKTQRSKLRRGLFPGHNHGAAKIGAAFGPSLQMRAVWGPLLEPAPAAAADGSRDSEAVRGQGSAEASMPVVGQWAGGRLLRLQGLDAISVARLHGFESPEELIRWERSCQRAPAEDFELDGSD